MGCQPQPANTLTAQGMRKRQSQAWSLPSEFPPVARCQRHSAGRRNALSFAFPASYCRGPWLLPAVAPHMQRPQGTWARCPLPDKALDQDVTNPDCRNCRLSVASGVISESQCKECTLARCGPVDLKPPVRFAQATAHGWALGGRQDSCSHIYGDVTAKKE